MKREEVEPLLESGGDPELADLFAAGRDELPNEGQLAIVAASLGSGLLPGGPPSTMPPPGPAAIGGGGGATAAVSSGVGIGVKLAAVSLFAAVAATGAWVATRGASEQASAPPRSSEGPARPERSEERAPASTGRATRTEPPEAPVELPRVEPPASPSPPAVPRAARRPRASAPVDRPEAPAEVAPPEDEVVMLSRAQRALASDPASALDILREHARHFPDGLHAQERERFAIEALVLLGRRDEARARADTFDARWPRSPHRRRIRVLLSE